MKIAFIIDTFPTISHTFIINQIAGLINKGHSFDIYAQKKAIVSCYMLMWKSIIF